MSEFLQSSAFRQILLALCGVALPIINAKFDLHIDDTQVAAALASITTIVVTSKVANAHVAGKEAGAKVSTLEQAVNSANSATQSSTGAP